MATVREQEDFIINYLREHHYVDVLNADFHEQFYRKFGGKRAWKFFGASPVYKAQKLLGKMYQDGTLERGIIGIAEHESGFPNWVYGYSINGRVTVKRDLAALNGKVKSNG